MGPFSKVRAQTSAGLAVSRMRPAPAAVLFHFQPVRSVGLVLGGDIVPPLALRASKSKRRSFLASHQALASFVRFKYQIPSTKYGF